MDRSIQHIRADPNAPHPTCFTHRNYRLTCEEFDELRQLKPGRCHMCDTETDVLNIEHDHALGD